MRSIIMISVIWVGMVHAVPVTTIRYEPGTCADRVIFCSPKPLSAVVIPQPPYSSSESKLFKVFIPHALLTSGATKMLKQLSDQALGYRMRVATLTKPCSGTMVSIDWDKNDYRCVVTFDRINDCYQVIFELRNCVLLQTLLEYSVDHRYA